jgi:sulfide:quinone oxidoreductase
MTRIAVLGSGFAALTAVRELRRQKVDAEIVVVSPQDTLTYLPSLIWVPSRLRNGADLNVPLADFYARHQVTWHQGTVLQVTDGGRRVVTSTGDLANDILVVATGARFLRKLPGIEHALIPCTDVASAEAIRDRLAALEGGTIALGFATNPAEPGAVRGGPMFEYLFGLDTLLRRQGRRDRFELVFFNPSAEPGQRLGKRAVTGLLAEMRRCGIRTYLGHKMVRFEAGRVVTEGGAIDADMILFLPGLTGPEWLDGSDLPRSPGGFVTADAACRVPGCERVYMVGDGGSYPGPDWMPKQAHQADLQALAAARNIAAELKGQPAAVPFRTELICIVDTLDAGVMVFRNARFNLVSPRLRALHWMKRAFEHLYLRSYRGRPAASHK